MAFRSFHLTMNSPTDTSAQARNTRNPSSSTHDIIQQVSAIERLITTNKEDAVPSATLRPFLAALRAYLSHDTPLERVEAKLDKLNATLAKSPPKLTTYAEVARRNNVRGPHASPPRNAPAESPKEAKLIRIRFSSKEDAQKLHGQPSETILGKLKEQINETPAVKGIVAAKKLPGGDLLLHTDSTETRHALQHNTNWVAKLGPTAIVHQSTFPVLVHSIPTASLVRLDSEAQAKRFETDNQRLHPGLSIIRTRWLRNPERQSKAVTSMILEVASATQANRLITEGVIFQCELKTTELFEPSSRIRQCFKCQQYTGHTSLQCKNEVRCGYCGDKHASNECPDKSKEPHISCAACNQGRHPSWSNKCPARLKELARARTAYESRRTLFPTPWPHPPPASMRSAREQQGFVETSDSEWQTTSPRKRKITHRKPGRLRKLDIPETTPSQNINFLFSQASSLRSAREPQQSTQESNHESSLRPRPDPIDLTLTDTQQDQPECN
jgi:hypothetical protein